MGRTRYGTGMERILISACLLGRPVRYNGTDKASGADDILALWREQGRLVPVCPEIAVGFPTPRPAAEIYRSDGDPQGANVLAGRASVIEETGRNVTALYVQAAQETVQLAQRHGCHHAVLTDGSPSCGSSFIYDGGFRGVVKPGVGTTTAALRAAGINVWPETRIAALHALLGTP